MPILRESTVNLVPLRIPPPDHPGPLAANLGQWLAVALLLLGLLLTNGCAAKNPGRSGDAAGKRTSAEIAPFPAYGKGALLEPTVVAYPDYRDPLILVNRGVFAFNDVSYRYLLIPLSKGYLRVIPGPVRQSVGNFFYNIKMPVYAVNHLLQLKPEPLGRNLLRFGLNSTVGLLGLFDPAKAKWGLERAETDFDETLAGYGTGYGIYLVLPFFGPSNLRDTTALVVDSFLNPVVYLTENPEKLIIQGFDNFQNYAPNAERYETLRRKSDDPYIFFRNLHLQGVQRDAEY
jgi:phospholipid-binding lipoprotein MlaA